MSVTGNAIDPIDRMCADPARAQRSALNAILHANEATEFCRTHSLSHATTPDDYRARVAIRGYDDHRTDIDRMRAGERNILVSETVEHWALTSGSTASPKLIPITRSGIRAMQVAQHLLLENISGAPIFLVSSPPEEGSVMELGLVALGTRHGRIHTPRPKTGEGTDETQQAQAQAHYRRIAEDITRIGARTIIAASPSTVLLVLDALPEATRNGIEAIACWCSGASSLYLPALRDRANNARIRDVGLSASEGYFTISTDGSTAALPIATHYLFELADEASGNVMGLHEAQLHGTYRLIVTTPSGLYRYDTEDIVEVTGMRAAMPLLTFSHRSGSVSSIAGEKLTEAQLVQAMLAVASKLDVVIEDFLAEIEWENDVPRYRVRVAAQGGPIPETSAAALDVALSTANIEYARKRSSGRLGTLRVERAGIQEFHALRNQKNSGMSAQYKLLPLRVRS